MKGDDMFGTLAVDDPAHNPLNCPFCKSSDGYFLKFVFSRQHYFTNDGIPQGVSEDYIIRGGKAYFCTNCEKDISRYVKKALKQHADKSSGE